MVSATYSWHCTERGCSGEFEQQLNYFPMAVPPIPVVPIGWTIVFKEGERVDMICPLHAVRVQVLDFKNAAA